MLRSGRLPSKAGRPDALVAFFGRPGAVIVDDLLPHGLGLADDDGLGVLLDLFRDEARVKAAHDHGHAPAAVLAGDLVAAPGGVGLDGHGDEVRGLVEGQLLHAVVVEAHLDVIRRQGRDERRGQRLHLPGLDVLLAGAAADAGVDQGEAERAAHAVAFAFGAPSWPMNQSQL
jgi:hypothetical protein